MPVNKQKLHFLITLYSGNTFSVKNNRLLLSLEGNIDK